MRSGTVHARYCYHEKRVPDWWRILGPNSFLPPALEKRWFDDTEFVLGRPLGFLGMYQSSRLQASTAFIAHCVFLVVDQPAYRCCGAADVLVTRFSDFELYP